MLSLEEQVALALKYYGESILTDEGKKDCFKKYGYNVWEHARMKFIFNQTSHPVSKKMLKKWQEDIDKTAGLATSKTLLEF